MKAQVLKRYDDDLTAAQWVSYENVPDPKLERSTDVIVRIGGAGVCRTDLHIIEGVWRPHMDPTGEKLLPLIMGHENAGWIEDVGKEVEGLKKGDPVIVHPKITNGTCLACRRGHDMHGAGKFPGLDCNGGYAEYLGTSERNIIKLPRTLAPKDGKRSFPCTLTLAVLAGRVRMGEHRVRSSGRGFREVEGQQIIDVGVDGALW